MIPRSYIIGAHHWSNTTLFFLLHSLHLYHLTSHVADILSITIHHKLLAQDPDGLKLYIYSTDLRHTDSVFSLNFGNPQHCVHGLIELRTQLQMPKWNLCMPLLRQECFTKATQSKRRTLPPLASVPLIFKLEARKTMDLPARKQWVSHHPSREYKAGKKIKRFNIFQIMSTFLLSIFVI